MRRLIPLLLAACLPLSFSGSNAPTDHTFRLTEADIEAASSNECALDWVGADAEANRKKALDILEKRKIRLNDKSPTGFITSTPRRLFLTPGFAKKPVAAQAEILTHELVHYCQRDILGADFEADYLHSAGRWRLEVPAYAQQIRTAIAHGAGKEEVSVWIPHLVGSMRNRYWLWDINPVQYDTETRRVWEAVGQ